MNTSKKKFKFSKIHLFAVLLIIWFLFILFGAEKNEDYYCLSSCNVSDIRETIITRKEGFEFEPNKYWRPEKVNSEVTIDLGAEYDDRILQQRLWMDKISQSSVFKDLKPKKILLEEDYLDISGKLDCADGGTQKWAPKCILKTEKYFEIRLLRYPGNIEDYDAVVEFRNFGPYKTERKLPKGSKVKQILFAMESPAKTGSFDMTISNSFLATFWRGSDIPVPYYKWIPFIIKNQTQDQQGRRNYAQNKTKLAAIAVSKCNETNQRLEYVRELQRHIPVEIYGQCGNLSCTEPCFENLKKDYKFYLSFENANCRDYITEKLFRNALSNDMVPVVMGAEKKDYMAAAPPHSFIHVEDFESPFELAQFLKHLDQNDDLYNKYFDWKSEGKLEAGFNWDFLCRACGLLFMADFAPWPVWPKGSLWSPETHCMPPGRWYWHRPNNK